MTAEADAVQGKKKPDTIGGSTAAVGVSGGTGFTGLVLLLPEGVLRSMLLILAPTITVCISASWNFIKEEINSRVSNWKIRNKRERLEKQLSDLNRRGPVDENIKKAIQDEINALLLLEVGISKKEVQAVASP